MTNEDGSIWIVFNGEIYNYKELRAELVVKGHVFHTDSDTETIIHLYEDLGEKLFQRLNGMFAFAIWDEKKHKLVIGRDRLGVKPLYWTRTRHGLAFSSELKSLLCGPWLSREIDPQAISLYLSFRSVPEPFTAYRGAQALLPGCYMVWEPGREPVIQRYWAIDFTPDPRGLPSEDELSDQLEDLLLDATRLRMRSDVPVGAYLSGGVDSSLVVSLVRRFYAGPLNTFSLGYADAPQDKLDIHFARVMAEKLDTLHHEHIMHSGELVAGLYDVIRHLDQPFSGVISTYFLTGLVRKHVKVMLSGDGADDQFGSYGHHRLAFVLRDLAEARRRGVEDPYAAVDLGPLRGKEDFVRPFEGLAPWEVRTFFGAFPDKDKLQLLAPEFRHWVKEYSAVAFMRQFWDTGTAQDPLNALLEADVQTLLPNEVLFFVDRLSMAHSVEVRSPFLDYRVMEFSAKIPGSLKIKGNILKYILRKVASSYLPGEIIDRPKEGFVLPNHVWLREGALDPLLADLLSPAALGASGFFDQDFVSRIVREHKDGVREHAFRIWTIIIFQAWYRTYLKEMWPRPHLDSVQAAAAAVLGAAGGQGRVEAAR
jgi:asparagine synthase (glutamine-hydrolysing)